MNPLFSIITCTYNAEHTLPRTLQSVQQQDFGLYEHIIIDGASTDGTLDIIKAAASDKLRYISEPDHGIYDAMNKGMAMAKGDYYIFLNAGDKFHSPQTLSTLSDVIFAEDYPGIVYGQTDIVDDTGAYIGPRHLQAPEKLTFESFAQGMLVCHQAMAVYSHVAVNYNLKYKYSADYEWCLECLKHSRRNVYVPKVTVDYLSEGTTTAHHFASLAERYRIMCRYYGTMPTIWRHLKFAIRYLRRRKGASNRQ